MNLPHLKIVWPTRSRSGSQFALSLTHAALGQGALFPQARINGYRKDKYREEEKAGDFKAMFEAGTGLQYFSDNSLSSAKYEDPGKDDFIVELMNAAPDARFIASYRSIESVLESHYNIKSWGHTEPDVLYQFSACAALYEELDRHKRLFLIPVDRKDRFSLERFLMFLGLTEATERLKSVVDSWTPVNDLAYQQKKATGEKADRKPVPRIEQLRNVHPWVESVEQRYLTLIRNSNQGD